MFRLIDTHAHLEEIENPGAILDRAKQAGVAAVIAVGSDVASNQKTLEIAGLYKDFVYPALGYHPDRIEPGEIEPTPFSFFSTDDGMCIF